MWGMWVAAAFGQDADMDSLLDTDEDVNSNGNLADDDWDSDGIPNYLDPDDDGDGVDTLCEAWVGLSHLVPDSDGDGLLDGAEFYNWLYLELVLVQGLPLSIAEYSDANGGLTGLGCNDAWDRDSDGIMNALDTDDDGDLLATGSDETGTDYDCIPGTQIAVGDGIPDYLDRDSDNDGIPDGLLDGEAFGDLDGDGIFDFIDCSDGGCLGDSDLDGLANCDEDDLCLFIGLGSCALNPDLDADGALDGLEVGIAVNAPLDTDGDLQPDFFDFDDDDDLVPSAYENGLVCSADLLFQYDVVNAQWTYLCVPTGTVPTGTVFDFGSNALEALPDFDGDLVPDFRDADDDGDGVPTRTEDRDGSGSPLDDDTDCDGAPDYLDADDSDGTCPETTPTTPTTPTDTLPTPTTTTDPVITNEKPAGCGCTATQRSSVLALLFAAVLSRRRRTLVGARGA